MEPKTIEKTTSSKEFTDALVQLSHEYTALYCAEKRTEKFNRELWGALHIGFYSALKFVGIPSKDLDQVIEEAKAQLKKDFDL